MFGLKDEYNAIISSNPKLTLVKEEGEFVLYTTESLQDKYPMELFQSEKIEEVSQFCIKNNLTNVSFPMDI